MRTNIKIVVMLLATLLLLTGCGTKYENEYDKDGNITKEYQFDKDNKCTGYICYEHGEDSYKEKELYYNLDDELQGYVTNGYATFPDETIVITANHYDANDKHITCVRDIMDIHSGELLRTETTHYKSDGSIESVETEEY